MCTCIQIASEGIVVNITVAEILTVAIIEDHTHLFCTHESVKSIKLLRNITNQLA